MLKRLIACVSVVFALGIGGSQAQQTDPPGVLDLGNAVVTGFSGTVAPDPQTLPPGTDPLDETLIDLDGISARILDIAAPGYVWDGRAWSPDARWQFTAGEIGQVFGVTLDDDDRPNIYLAATSAYGLPIVLPDADSDGRPERLLEGEPGARFMDGLFSPLPGAGPGSILKVDGITGEVSVLANVELGGAANPGPGLGNITFDAAHRQLFVSDRATGMIHRIGLDGVDLEHYDHGVTGRTAEGLPAVTYDPAGALDITRGDFDTEDPDSWGYAAGDRQVWGLAVHDGRLFYAVVDDSQVWSVGIEPLTGAFAGDPRWELDVPKQPEKLPVSDIVFTERGAMILAQRGSISSTYDYAGFAETGESRLYRYWLESPDDPLTPSRWIAIPEEYAVGFPDDNRRTSGGIDLQYGYTVEGRLDLTTCEASLWSTGDDLRLNPDLATDLLPGGPLALDGLQGMPAFPVKPLNTPPWASYMVDLDARADDAAVDGHPGDIAIYRACGGGAGYVTSYGGAGYPSEPPYVSGPYTPEDPLDPVDPPLCSDGSSGSACPEPEFEITKTCEPFAIDPQSGKPRSVCSITVTSNGVPFEGELAVSEGVVFGGSTPFNETIVGVSSADDWSCDQPPFADTDPAVCTIDWQGLAAAGNSSVIDVEIELPDPGFLVETQNCVALTLDGVEVGFDCVDFEGVDLEPVDLGIEKTYAAGANGEAGSFTLTVTNVGAPFDVTDAVTVTDAVPAGMTITAATGPDWDCAPIPVTGPATITCLFLGTGTVPTGATSQIVLTATTQGSGTFENCANVLVSQTSGYEDTNPANDHDCATVTGDDGGFDPVGDPPPLAPMCGTNVIFVVDESRSIADANATYYITNALANAASLFNANGSQAAVIRFSDSATLVYPMASSTYPLVNVGYNPAAGGGTNWEAGMLAALGLLPSPNTVIVFITDGIPTAYLDAASAVTYTTNSVLATNEAIAAVNAIYATGTPIVGIGIGNVSTHLNALLGTSTTSSFGALNADLTALAQELCPDLYLTKQISPNYINFHGLTANPQATVTLTATNTTGVALTGVVVQDALPSELTNPTGFSQTGVVVTGNVVDWTIPTLAPAATATLTFQVEVAPSPAPTPQWRCIPNYAQVTASGGTVNSTPNNMANTLTGPVAEHDEASSSVCVIDYETPPPTDCGDSYLWVTKKADFAEVCVPGGSPGCTFTITVRAQCKAFNGPVLFGEGVTNGSSPVGAPIGSITNDYSPAICPWSSGWSGTSTPSWCSANISLPVNQAITFNVTLDAPLPAGSGYVNCFVADGKTPQPADYNAAFADVNPTTTPNGAVWGNCAPFSVAAPAAMTIAPPPAPEPEPLKCDPPSRLNAAGTRCITPAPEPLACKAPARPNNAGTACICPADTIAQGTACVPRPPEPIVCRPPARPNAAGTACVCPENTVAEGTRCVPREPEKLTCRAPAVPNRAGTACVCPENTIAAAGRCLPRPPVEIQLPDPPKLNLPGGLFGGGPRG